MLWIGPTSSIFDITTYALMWYVFAANSVEHRALFQSGWFIEGCCRKRWWCICCAQKIPFIQSTAALPVLLTTGLVMALGIYIPFSPLGAWLACSRCRGNTSVVGRYAGQLLRGRAVDEAFLYPPLRRVALSRLGVHFGAKFFAPQQFVDQQAKHDGQREAACRAAHTRCASYRRSGADRRNGR